MPTREPIAAVATTPANEPGDRRSTVVLLDLDGTCVPDCEATQAAAERLFSETRAFGNPEDQVAQLLETARQLWQLSPYREFCLTIGISSWEGLWLRPLGYCPEGFAEWVREFQEDFWSRIAVGSSVNARFLATRYRELRELQERPYPGVPDLLNQLMTRHRLWLLTNGDHELQMRKVNLSGLNAYFDRVFVSSALGAAKPATQFFDQVVAEANAANVKVVVSIGDSEKNDIEPAVARGWPAVLVGSPSAIPSVAHIKQLKMLLTVVDL